MEYEHLNAPSVYLQMLSLDGGRRDKTRFDSRFIGSLWRTLNVEHKAQHKLFVETVYNVLSCPLGCLRCVANIGDGGE